MRTLCRGVLDCTLHLTITSVVRFSTKLNQNVSSHRFEQTEDTMLAARRIARGITDFRVTIFHQTFVYFDQPVVVWSNTLQNMIIAVICMFFVALMFVPHILCALWVTAAAASIEIGVSDGF